MTAWLIALSAGLLVALAQYGLRPRARLLIATLRAFAVATVVALLLDAPAGARVVPSPDVALDASSSWTRAGCNAWPAALDSATRLGNGRLVRFGDSVRVDASHASPADNASRVQGVVDRASAAGRPVIVITDGELDDAGALAGLPGGSRVIVVPCRRAADVGVASLEAPRTGMVGDTVAVRVMFVSGDGGSRATRAELRLDDQLLATTELAAFAPLAERAWEPRFVLRGSQRAGVLRVVLSAGDAEPRNDSLGVALEVSATPSAVFVSTAPDFDAREAAAALRSATSKAARTYYRIAPGAWRQDGALTAVAESEVRAAVREAPLVVLHGDTALFGAPRAATKGSLLLFAPPAADEGEWFAELPRNGTSPLGPVVSAVPFDSLPPVGVSSHLPAGEWVGLASHRGGAPEDRRPMLAGWESPRRVIVLGATGLWRWRFRGGVRADAYVALMGGIYDWLSAARPDRRAVLPPQGVIREGAPIRWQKGAMADSSVSLGIARRGDAERARSVTVTFGAGVRAEDSPALARGTYDVRGPGGSSVLVVNASRELLPRRPSVSSSRTVGAASAGDARGARSEWWMYALAITVLSAEWILRRRQGLR